MSPGASAILRSGRGRRQLNADDIAGGTFSITNDGPFGTYFTVPIINQPQVAILATDGIARRPVVVTQSDGSESIAIHSTGILGVSWDHRAVDGAYVSLFLARDLGAPQQPRLGRRALRAAPVLRIRSLGTVPYHEAYVLQHALGGGAGDDYLLLLEHPHTYTLGAHADERHVLVDPALVGATLERTDRGGDVTYHGPGQLVAYPIVDVPDDPASGPAHVHRLEQIVIATLADLGLPGATSVEAYPGVWIDGDGPSPRKIAAIGVRTLPRRPRTPTHAPRRRPQRDLRPRHVRAHRALRHRGPWGDLAAGRGDRRGDGRGRRGLRRPGGRRLRRRRRRAP